MRLDTYNTIDRKSAHISFIRIDEEIVKYTTKDGTSVNYNTKFYEGGILIKIILLPMISNNSLNHICTELELKRAIGL